MKKAADKRKPTTTADVDIEQLVKAAEAKQRFFGATLGMSWRLIITFMVPVLIGIWIDNRYKTTPSGTLVGFMVGVGAGAMAVWSTVKEVNEIQAEDEKKEQEEHND